MKKFMSVVLALLMLAVMLPVTAMAAGVADVDSLKQAAADGTGTVSLGADIDLKGTGGGEQVAFTKDVTIDLNGFTLKGMVQFGSYLQNDPTVVSIIKDSNSSNSKYSVISNYERQSSGAMLQFAAIDVMKPNVVIESGRYTSNNAVINNQVQGVYDLNSVVIKGGQFDATDGGVCIANIIGKVVVENGAFTAENGGAIIYADSGDSKQETVTIINNGTFIAEDGVAISFGSSAGKVEINGGVFSVNEMVDESGEEGALTINGGTFCIDDLYMIESYIAGDKLVVEDALNFYVGDAANQAIANATAGSTLTVRKGSEVNNVPAGVTIENGTREKITVNGNLVDVEGSFTPAPTTIVIIQPAENKPAEDQKNPSTGANDFVGIAAAMAVISVMGAAVVARKK